MSVGERIHELRKELGYTQIEFGKMVRCSGATISTSESGKTTPDNQTLQLIADKCGVRYEWLAEGTLPKYPPEADNDIVLITRAMEGQSEGKKRLMRLIAEMPDDLADAFVAFMDGRQNK